MARQAVALATMVLLMAATARAAGRIDDNNAPPAVTHVKPPLKSLLWVATMKNNPAVVAELKAVSTSGLSSDGGQGGAGRFSAASDSVVRHATFVKQQADATVQRALGPAANSLIRHYYTHTVAGFSIGPLTRQQVVVLRQQPNVKSVVPDAAIRGFRTISTPSFLGLDTPGGAWSQLGGESNAGEDIIIGVLDSGYTPEHPSFSDRADPMSNSGQVAYGPPPTRFKGVCQPGQNFTEATCNHKIIGCRFFNAGWGSAENLQTYFGGNEIISCRDVAGHGTHTASTAAGNRGIASKLAPPGTGMSGMAPRARLSIYKCIWGSLVDGYAWASDIIAAVDAAVADGVDVISYSLDAGGAQVFQTLFEMAFKNAVASGVVFSVAAGNSGPAPGTIVDTYGPWIITVAASTHNRCSTATTTLGNGDSFTGAGLSFARIGPAQLALAADVASSGADPEEARLCFAGTLDAVKAAGKIMACNRGINARAAKAVEVGRVGGVGMLLLDAPGASMGPVAEVLAVPHIHLPLAAYDSIHGYAASAGSAATAVLEAAVLDSNATAPAVADMSSRGPIVPGDGNLLKPDIAAPGIDVLAAWPPSASPAGFASAYASGTSMAAPHIAGIAALLKQKYPDWSTAAIKSALMTTAYQTTRTGEAGQASGEPFGFGAGYVDPVAAMLRPGLVLDSGPAQWQRFICGAEVPTSQWPSACPECVADPSLCDPSNLNYPSIAASSVAGSKVILRTLTSVLAQPAEFIVSVQAPAGFDVMVSPPSFSLDPGASQVVTVRVEALPGTPTGQWRSGSITWSSSQATTTRIPVVLKAAELSIVPAEIRLQPRVANYTFSITPSWSGHLSSLVVGLQPAQVFRGAVFRNAAGDLYQQQDVNFTIKIAPGGSWSYARFAVSPDTAPGDPGLAAKDLDLFVYDSSDDIVGQAATVELLDEEVNLVNPSGTFTVQVVAPLAAGVKVSRFQLHVMVLRLPAPGSSNAVSRPTANKPAMAVAGQPLPITVTLNSRLVKNSGSRFLGAVLYGKSSQDALQRGLASAKSFTLLYLP